MNRNIKLIIICVLGISLLFVSVGYAAYSSRLTVLGSIAAKPTSDSWRIVFKSMNNDNILTPVLGGNATEATSATLTDTTISGFIVNFLAPGDQVTYNFKVVNEGKTDAKLSLKSIGSLTCTPKDSNVTDEEAKEFCNNLTMTITYQDGSPIITNTNLNSGEEKSMKLVVLWKQSSAFKFSGDIDITVGESALTYTQYIGPSTLLENSTAKYCTYDGDMVQGAEYTDGTYTYRYKQYISNVSTSSPYTPTWSNLSNDGWSVVLSDKTDTGTISKQPCTYINDKPVIRMDYMFANSQATELDLSSFDTSKVTIMSYMFSGSQATSIDLSSFDTSKVIIMSEMFSWSQVLSLDLSSFNTSNVTIMQNMFYESQATSIDLSSFEMTGVINTTNMFYHSQATTGYAKNAANAAILNGTTNKPAGLTFVVK